MKKSDGCQMAKLQALLLPVAAISMVFVMIIPVPSVVLDILLAASITASVIVFLTAVQVRRAVDFSVFPTLLLLLTLPQSLLVLDLLSLLSLPLLSLRC